MLGRRDAGRRDAGRRDAGRTRLDTTAIYTEVAIEHLRSVYTASHPSAQQPGDNAPKVR